jgi:hypothetical protein
MEDVEDVGVSSEIFDLVLIAGFEASWLDIWVV